MEKKCSFINSLLFLLSNWLFLNQLEQGEAENLNQSRQYLTYNFMFKQTKRMSLSDFKAKAAITHSSESLEKIKGGAYSHCHPDPDTFLLYILTSPLKNDFIEWGQEFIDPTFSVAKDADFQSMPEYEEYYQYHVDVLGHAPFARA